MNMWRKNGQGRGNCCANALRQKHAWHGHGTAISSVLLKPRMVEVNEMRGEGIARFFSQLEAFVILY